MEINEKTQTKVAVKTDGEIVSWVCDSYQTAMLLIKERYGITLETF